jgi:peptide/nickel transport system substrate-binding protein/oligopeptide transport system substrate-binding protein
LKKPKSDFSDVFQGGKMPKSVRFIVLIFLMVLNMGLAQATYPDNAAPVEEQVLRMPCDNTANATTFDFAVAVYQRFCGNALDLLFSEPLTTFDKEFNVIPVTAESWSVAADGVTWTFNIKKGLEWSDGTPVTAHDYEATYRLTASPEHAWDFAWFYNGIIKNWTQAVAGDVPVEEIGMKAVDDYTLEIVTETPFPPLPGVMTYSWTLQKKALEEHGPFYNNDLATHVSSGPFTLNEFDPGNLIVLEANPSYKGIFPPRLQRLEGIYMARETYFAAFQNGEIDRVPYEALSPADFAIVESDPVLSENYLRHFGDFRTDYLLFDTFNPPFNDINVRKAFAYAVDREAIVKNVYGEIKAMSAHAMLMPGFPDADVDGTLSEYQTYDCDKAKQHLADAGFADGEGFPVLEMWMRNEGAAMSSVYTAVAASISDCLGVSIEASNKDFKVYMDALNAKPTQLTFGAVSYGMDFVDASNMLGIWVSTGRHSWKNEAFDKLVIEAGAVVDDMAKRSQMFKDAEKILVDDVGGVFIAHRWQGDLFAPYVQGDSIRVPDSKGISGWHFNNLNVISDLYIAKQ